MWPLGESGGLGRGSFLENGHRNPELDEIVRIGKSGNGAMSISLRSFQIT
jgi:hypothetical protein